MARSPLLIFLLWSISLVLGIAWVNAEESADDVAENDTTIVAASDAALEEPPLIDEIESIKKSVLELNRDLLILEENLLFPANTQVAVYVSMDVGEYFVLDSVELRIDDTLVASHLYTERQLAALKRGGVQRLYLGNLKSGEHEVTAFFLGEGPQKREYKRGATYALNKTQSATMLEIKITDSKATMQPEFEFKLWKL